MYKLRRMLVIASCFMFSVLSFCNSWMNFVLDWNSLNCTGCDALGGYGKHYQFGGSVRAPKSTKEAISRHDKKILLE